jgi:hypothetical protein
VTKWLRDKQLVADGGFGFAECEGVDRLAVGQAVAAPLCMCVETKMNIGVHGSRLTARKAMQWHYTGQTAD